MSVAAAAAQELPAAQARLTITASTDGSMLLAFAGRLDTFSIGQVWAQARAALATAPTRRIGLDASGVDYCDGGGVAMLVDLLRQPRAANAAVSLRGLRPEFQALLDQFDLTALAVPAAPPPARRGLIEDIGRAAATLGRDLSTQIAFVGATSAALWYAITHPQRVRWKDIWYTCEQVGADALPIVALISFLFGVILAFEAAVPMRQFGAEIFVADLVGLSVLRELGPLMTAILLAGRSGAAFAAEIGTMKVNEELDALTTMGLDPVRFLVVTRIVAAVLMVPLLAVFADLIGILAGGLTMLSFNIPFVTYLKEVASIADLKEVLVGLAKTPVFALLIAGIGCLRGLETQTGASAVGISTTRAVVSGIVLLVAVDGIFSVIYYILDL